MIYCLSRQCFSDTEYIINWIIYVNNLNYSILALEGAFDDYWNINCVKIILKIFWLFAIVKVSLPCLQKTLYLRLLVDSLGSCSPFYLKSSPKMENNHEDASVYTASHS